MGIPNTKEDVMKGKGLENNDYRQAEAEQIAEDFISYLNSFHAKGIQNDNNILVQLYKDYAEKIPQVPIPRFNGTYNFRSSSTGACAREHYVRLKKMKADPRQGVLPQTTRWQNLGTRIGDMIQFDILLAEKHHTGQFKFERVENNYPHFEEFSTTTKYFERDGRKFCIHGSTDGIMIYTKEDGTQLRVGLEVKSKQTSYSKTSLHSMRHADIKHKKQTITYSLMFDVDYWIIVYVNASKKAWKPTEEDMQKCPDIRAFGHFVTDEMKKEVLDRFTYICKCVDDSTPPPLELENWAFNNYKKSCASTITTKEMIELCDYVVSDKVKELPQWKQESIKEALFEVNSLREVSNG